MFLCGLRPIQLAAMIGLEGWKVNPVFPQMGQEVPEADCGPVGCRSCLCAAFLCRSAKTTIGWNRIKTTGRADRDDPIAEFGDWEGAVRSTAGVEPDRSRAASSFMEKPPFLFRRKGYGESGRADSRESINFLFGRRSELVGGRPAFHVIRQKYGWPRTDMGAGLFPAGRRVSRRRLR